MKLAKSKTGLVDLQNISASQLQVLFEQGKRDELTCPLCSGTCTSLSRNS